MEININSPGKQWFNREAVLINGIEFSKHNFKIKKPEGITSEIIFEPLPSMTRYEVDNLYHTKKTELTFLNNVLNVCEFYDISHYELERLIELKAGYIPGWIKEYLQDFENPKKSISLQTMRIKAAIIDELTGMNNGSGINFFIPSVLYYDFGLTYSLAEILFIAPEHLQAEITRQFSSVKVATLSLQAKKEYCINKAEYSSKSVIKLRRHYLPEEQI